MSDDTSTEWNDPPGVEPTEQHETELEGEPGEIGLLFVRYLLIWTTMALGCFLFAVTYWIVV